MRRWSRTVRAGVALTAVALAATTMTTAALGQSRPRASAARSRAVTVGTASLARCHIGAGRPTYCGSIRVPLDYADPRAPEIKVGFGWVPSVRPAVGTLVAMEGGPGYPSTGSSGDYAAMYGDLLSDHDLLLVDARGTGRSTPMDCRRLQRLPSPSPRFQSALTACGRQLNHTWRRTDGGWVHASDLFTTTNTARDLDRVLTALDLDKVDLYGDSYGTYFAQSFLARYPERLHSVVLDSAYEARDLDPWYRTSPEAARHAFDAVCRLAIDCPRGSSWHRIGALARQLRAHPVTGRVPGTDARRHRYTVDITALVNIVNDAGYDTDPYRQLDAAARAYLQHRDPTPLLRLYAQDVGWDYSDYVRTPASYYSDGLYFAIACTEYPQLFDMHRSPAVRRQQLATRVSRFPDRVFRPFTTREWTHVLGYTEAYRACVTWPKPAHRADPAVPPGPMDPMHVPVLVLNGALDSLTPAAGGAHVAEQIGPAARAYVAANNVHLVALYHADECGARVMRRFIATNTVRPSCLASIPPIRAVPQFPRSLTQVTPARGRASLRARRLATIAVAAAGDAVIRFHYVDGRRDLGLRGGRIRYDPAGDARLARVRWTSDTTVSGRVTVAGRGGHGTLTVTSPHWSPQRVAVRWGNGGYATAVIGGVRLRVPAP